MVKYIRASKEDYIKKYGLDTIVVEDDYIQLWANQGQTEVILNKTGKTVYVTVYDSGKGHSYWGNKDYLGNPTDSARHSQFTFTIKPHGQKIIECGPDRIQDIQIHRALRDGTYEASFDSGSAYNDWIWGRVAVESASNVYDDIGLGNYSKPEYKEWRKANNVVTLQDLCEQEGKRIVRYNAVPMDATGIETVFDFSSRLGGCVDSFRYYNYYVIIDK